MAFAATDPRRRQILTASLDTAVDVGCTDILIMHRHDVTVIAARVALLVIDCAADVLRVARTVDARKLLQLVIVDVLRRPIILQQCLHVLLVAVGACVVSLHSVRSFHILPLVVGRNQIQTQLARLDKLDVATLANQLLLTGHDGGFVVY